MKIGPQRWTERLTNGNGFGGNLYKITAWDDTGGDHFSHLELDHNDAFWGSEPSLGRVYFLIYQDAAVAVSDYNLVSVTWLPHP
jgi:hypothetical protein